MKKIISVLIVLAMIASVFPVAFAEGETETVVTSSVETYTFTSTGIVNLAQSESNKSQNSEYVERKIGDDTYYLPAEYYTGYNGRGWRVLDVNDETVMKVSNYEGRIFRIYKSGDTDFLQLNLVWNDHASGKYTGTQPKLDLALAFEAPEKTGFYIPKLIRSGSSVPTGFYVKMLSEEKNKLNDYISDKSSSFSTSGYVTTINNAVYTSSEDEIVLAFTGPTQEYRFDYVTLTEILEPTLVFSKTAYSLNLDGENSQILTEVYVKGNSFISGATEAKSESLPVSSDFVTYKSSDENVVKIESDGTIKAVGKGSATICAETKDGAYKTQDIPVTVNGELHGREYILNHQYGPGTSAVIYLSELNYYGSHGWMHIDVADVIEENKQTHVAQVGTSANGLIFYLKTKKVDSKLAYAISLEAPSKAAFYVPQFDPYINNSSGNIIDWYMSAPDSEKTTAEAYCTDENKIYTTEKIKYSNHPIQIADYVVYTTPGEELVSAMSAPKDDYKFFRIILAELLNPELKIALENTSLDMTTALTTTASAKISGSTKEKTTDRKITNKEITSGSIVYKSTDEAVAKVDASGVVTAIGAGEAKIYAESKDGLVKSNEVAITVSAPAAPEDDEELSEAFDVTETPATDYVESSVTGLTDDSTIEATKNSNGTFTLTAPETKEDSKFLYWAKGMSSNKKIISFENVISNYMPEEDGKNYLIAVYEDDVTDTAEYYNANGQRIATGTAPEYPSMAGYGKATGWARYGETNIYVAEYAGKTQPDDVTIMVDGKSQTIPYGTEITCTADNAKENFKCWTKSDINGKTEIVSANENYIFRAWENCTVTAIYEEHIYTGAKMKIILDTFTAGEQTAVMAEFIGFENAVEKGIMFGSKKIAMTKPGNQFTVLADDAGTFTGYAIVGNKVDGFKLITDGSVTVR